MGKVRWMSGARHAASLLDDACTLKMLPFNAIRGQSECSFQSGACSSESLHCGKQACVKQDSATRSTPHGQRCT